MHAHLSHGEEKKIKKEVVPAKYGGAGDGPVAAAAAQDLALLSADDLERHGVEKRDAAAIADVLAVKVPPRPSRSELSKSDSIRVSRLPCGFQTLRARPPTGPPIHTRPLVWSPCCRRGRGCGWAVSDTTALGLSKVGHD